MILLVYDNPLLSYKQYISVSCYYAYLVLLVYSLLPLGLNILPTASLSWLPGEDTADVNGHDVYLGTSFSDVNNANKSVTLGVYKGRQNQNSYDPGTMVIGQEYFWRARAVDDEGNPGPWSFVEIFYVKKGENGLDERP